MKKILVGILASVLILFFAGCGRTATATGSDSNGNGGGSQSSSGYWSGNLNVRGTIIDNTGSGYIIAPSSFSPSPISGAKIKLFQFVSNGLQEMVGGEFSNITTNAQGEYTLPMLDASKLHLMRVVNTSPEIEALVYGQGNVTIDVDPLKSFSSKMMSMFLQANGLFYRNLNASYFKPLIDAFTNEGKEILADRGKNPADMTEDEIMAEFNIFEPSVRMHQLFANLIGNAFGNDNYSVVRKDADWSKMDSFSKWNEISGLINQNNKIQSTPIGGFSEIDITNIKLARTETTLNILLVFNPSLPLPANPVGNWKGINAANYIFSNPLDQVPNNGLIGIDLHSNMLYHCPRSGKLMGIGIFHKDGSWQGHYLSGNGSGYGGVSSAPIPQINTYNENVFGYGAIELALPFPEAFSGYFYVKAEILKVIDSWLQDQRIAFVPYTRVSW
jgi:hypothetical protein